jgi:hypothetical protein
MRSAEFRAEDVLERRQHPGGAGVLEPVVERLALAAVRDQPVFAQLGEMLRERRLTELDRLGTSISPRATSRQRMSRRFSLARSRSRRAASLALSWSRIRSFGVTASIRGAPESDIRDYLETPNIACLVRLAITVHTGKVTGSGQELSFQ